MNKRYRTLFFDLDDTLFDYTGDEKRCIKKVFEKHGMTVDDDVYELYYSIDDWQHFQMGNITSKTVITDHFGRMLKMLEVKGEDAQTMVDEFFDCMVSSHRLKVGAKNVLEYLYDNGYNLYITSNGFPDVQRKRIADSGIDKYFNGIFISEEMDLRKPGVAYFRYVFARIPESRKEKVLLIGDAPTSDILGGINAGIDTCWLESSGKICKYKYTYKIKTLKELTEFL